MEPGVEAVGVADGANVQPGGHERLLDGIGRPVVAPQDQPRGSMQPIERTRGERREGVVVAVPRAKDEVSLHRTPGSWRPLAALTNHESGGNRVVPSRAHRDGEARLPVNKDGTTSDEPDSYRAEALDMPALCGRGMAISLPATMLRRRPTWSAWRA